MVSAQEISQAGQIRDARMRVAVIGCGYVGLVTGVCLAEVGHEVHLVDLDKKKIEMLNSGKAPIYELGLDLLLQSNKPSLHFYSDITEAIQDRDIEVIFIAVGTPSDKEGHADLTALFRAARSLIGLINEKTVVVVKSTVPVGTCDNVAEMLDTQRVISNPEFLKEGTAVKDCLEPDRVVIGHHFDCNDAVDIMIHLYYPIVRGDYDKIVLMDRRSSEMTKYAANVMLAARLSMMNELAVLCEKYDADIEQVRLGIGKDERIGPHFLKAGPGYGGSCFPKDVSALLCMAEKVKVEPIMLSAIKDRNDNQRYHAACKILDYFRWSLQDKRIVVWGLAFKAGTDDARESPALEIIRTLVEKDAMVVAHDPKATETFQEAFGDHDNLSYNGQYGALFGADALVLLTDWDEYKKPNWELIGRSMYKKTIFDFRNIWDREHLERDGFYYESIGRAPSATFFV